MLVREVMTRAVGSCCPEQTLTDAARIMRELDVGCVPVINNEGQPIAMITDRDICLAAYASGKPLSELHVSTVMSRGIHSCMEHDTVANAERTMRDWQVRRLPVVNAEGRLAGILSLNDLVLQRSESGLERAKERVLHDITDTLKAICQHRHV